MKPIRVHSAKRRLGKDRKGSIEGLPLYLMIVIMIATLSTAVIVGWMGNIETPTTIDDIEIDQDYVDLTHTVRSADGYYHYCDGTTITILDSNDNPVEGATVILSGLGVSLSNGDTAAGITDENGNITFDDLRVRISGNHGSIKVTASKTGLGESTCDLAVIR